MPASGRGVCSREIIGRDSKRGQSDADRGSVLSLKSRSSNLSVRAPTPLDVGEGCYVSTSSSSLLGGIWTLRGNKILV